MHQSLLLWQAWSALMLKRAPSTFSVTWRRPQVVRLLRACRLEEVRQHLILTIARPLYHGWGHVGALEDLWSFLASAVSMSATPFFFSFLFFFST